MRGKGIQTDGIEKISGITPAYAGKSTGNRLAIHIEWDHPRLCGEKIFCSQLEVKCMGITPAYAGKSH